MINELTRTVSRTSTTQRDVTGQVGPVGIEPTTRGLKVRCSAS